MLKLIILLILLVLVDLYNLGIKSKKREERQNNQEQMKETVVEYKTIIVPDEVDAKQSTRKSTQAEECKKYDVTKKGIEKIVIKDGIKEKSSKFENTENIEKEDIYSNYEENDNPIKEKKSLLSKLFGANSLNDN